MKNIILICFALFSFTITAQTRRIESNITKLNNNQFNIDHSRKASFSTKGAASRKLISFGQAAVPKLIEALKDSDKIIMAHLVLCHIYFKHVSFAGPKEKITDDKTVYKYYLGEEKGEGLIVSETKHDSVYKIFIEAKDMEDIISYWKNKTKH